MLDQSNLLLIVSCIPALGREWISTGYWENQHSWTWTKEQEELINPLKNIFRSKSEWKGKKKEEHSCGEQWVGG